MEQLIIRLEKPDSFKTMSEIILNQQVISSTKSILESRNVELSPRVFLAAWMISRFPEVIENTSDETLKSTADAVVYCCKSNYGFGPVLNLFMIRLNSWKNVDVDKLAEELVITYRHLCNQQVEDEASDEMLESTKAVLIREALKIGGKDLVANLSKYK